MLSVFPSWSNARDIKSLAKDMAAVAFRDTCAARGKASLNNISLSISQATNCMNSMVETQRARCSEKKGNCKPEENLAVPESQMHTDFSTPTPVELSTETSTSSTHAPAAACTMIAAQPDPYTQSAVRRMSATDPVPDTSPQMPTDSGNSIGGQQVQEEPAPFVPHCTIRQNEIEEIPENQMPKDSDDSIRDQQEQAGPSPLAAQPTIRQHETEEIPENQSLKEPPAGPSIEVIEVETETKKEEKEEKAEETVEHPGRCSAGYEWLPDGTGYVCSAGGHRMAGHSHLGSESAASNSSGRPSSVRSMARSLRRKVSSVFRQD